MEDMLIIDYNHKHIFIITHQLEFWVTKKVF